MEIDFSTASFKDFENVQGLDAWQRADLFKSYLNYLSSKGGLNYRLVSRSGCGPQMEIVAPGQKDARLYTSFVKWILTDAGKEKGGQTRTSSKYGEYIVWPENLSTELGRKTSKRHYSG